MLTLKWLRVEAEGVGEKGEGWNVPLSIGINTDLNIQS